MYKLKYSRFHIWQLLTLVLVLILSISCNLNSLPSVETMEYSTTPPSSTGDTALGNDIEVEMGIPESVMKNLKSGGAKGLTSGLTVTAKAFDATTRALVATASLTTFTVTNDPSAGMGKYSGTITIPPSQTEDIYLHVYAVYPAEHANAGQIAAQGTSGTAIAPTFTLKLPISSSTSYPLGSFGPGGGWIVYSNESGYTQTGTKNWRYIEMAPTGWDSTLGSSAVDPTYLWGKRGISAGTTLADYGWGYDYTTTIKAKMDNNNNEIDTVSFVSSTATFSTKTNPVYVSVAGSSSTLATLLGTVNNPKNLTAVNILYDGTNLWNTLRGEGYASNSSQIVSEISPGIIGRGTVSITIRAVTNTVAQVVSSKTVNGYSDWKLPTQNELDAMYSQRVLAGVNFVNGIYWSSTELTGALNAYARNLSNGTIYNVSTANGDNAKSVARYVRPVRYF